MAAGIIVIRTALYLTMMVLFGLTAFGLHGLRGEKRRSGAGIYWRGWIVGSALSAAVLSALALLMLAASMADVGLLAVDRATVGALLSGTPVGTAWLVRMIALAVAAVAGFRVTRTPIPALTSACLAGGVALGSLAWSGHGAMDDGVRGWVHLSADLVHLWAAGMWIGALLGLSLLVARRRAWVDAVHLELTHRALAQFAWTGALVVAALVGSGLINAWFLVGLSELPRLTDSSYGRLLIVKLGLFALMLPMAALNRFRWTPALARSSHDTDGEIAMRRLRHSVGIEAGLGVIIMSVVAWLGALEPPMASG